MKADDADSTASSSGNLSTLVELGKDLLAAAKLLQAVFITASPSQKSEYLGHIQSLEEASNATVRDVVRGLDPDGSKELFSPLQTTILLQALDAAMDALEEAADFAVIYAVGQATDQAATLTSFLLRAAEELLGCL